MPGHFIKGYLPHTVAVLAFAALALVSTLFWKEVNQRFQRPTPGAYTGTLEFSDGARPCAVYVEAFPDRNELLFSVLKADWKPQLLKPVPAPSDAGSAHSVVSDGALSERPEWFLPVAIEGPSETFTLLGVRSDGGRYDGTLVGVATGDRAALKLSALVSEDSDERKEEMMSIRLWLLLKAELASIDSKIKSAQERVPAQRAEIEKLTSILGEGERLKSKANEKFEFAQKDYEAARGELKDRREEVAKLWSAFDISQRVTKSGKLVALARESLEKDWQWAQASVDLAQTQTNDELEAAYERAVHITELKRSIDEERRKIQEITGMSSDALDFRARMSPPKKWR